MDPDILRDFEGNPVVPGNSIDALLRTLGHDLPTDYLSFMTKFDGGEGFIGDQYVVLWKIEEIVPFNKEYEVEEYAPGLLLFGSNGGGEGFAFNLLEENQPIVEVPFIGMDVANAIPISPTFSGFLEAAAVGNI